VVREIDDAVKMVVPGAVEGGVRGEWRRARPGRGGAVCAAVRVRSWGQGCNGRQPDGAARAITSHSEEMVVIW